MSRGDYFTVTPWVRDPDSEPATHAFAQDVAVSTQFLAVPINQVAEHVLRKERASVEPNALRSCRHAAALPVSDDS